MLDKDIITFAWMSLWRRKLRTILTLVGIMIGTAGIITMVSLGIGLEKSVTGEFEGSNMTSIEVYPGEDMGPSGAETVKVLKDDNVNKIKQMDGVKAVTPIYQAYGKLTIGRETIDATYTGIDMTEAEELGYKLIDGRFPRSSEVILGSNLLEQLVSRTGKDNFTRKSAKIILSAMEENVESTEFRTRVGGILESSGGAEDYSVTMDVDKLVDYVEKSTNTKNIVDNQGYSSIKVVATDMDVMDSLSQEINDAGYMSFSMKDILESIGSVFKFVQLFLGGVGSIALVVAAVGITNTMIMSTYERTKEIGVNKVIGASIKDIRKQFLYEATFIGLLGGISGLIFSYILSMIINVIATMFLQGETTIKVTQIPIWLALFAIVFSTIVGILAGLYPANKAAKISVLEALRTE